MTIVVDLGNWFKYDVVVFGNILKISLFYLFANDFNHLWPTFVDSAANGTINVFLKRL